MSRRPRGTLRVALVLSFVACVSGPIFGETPRTPWGDPDLQRMWVNNSATPLQRPDAFQGKETLTDEELQELKKKAAEVLDGGDAFFADDFVAAAVEEGTAFRSFDQKTGNYNQFFMGSSGTGAPKDGADPAEKKQGKKQP